jgi:Kdo2-lipid IVA lauroyltransferase/acyltransferase
MNEKQKYEPFFTLDLPDINLIVLDKYITLAVIGILKLFSYLPFRLLYLVSDLLYLVIYHIVRYRRVVVKENLQRSFPQKTRRELHRIEKEYYRYLCDIRSKP